MRIHTDGHGILTAAKRARVTIASRGGVEGRLIYWTPEGDTCRVLIGGRYYNINKGDIDIVEYTPVERK